nr:YndJ family transporter [Neobacillus terrae]
MSILIYFPIYLKLVQDESHLYLFLKKYQPVFSLAAVFSFLLPPLSLFWLVFCFAVGTYGLLRFFQRGGFYIEESLIDFSMLYLALGGIWFAVFQMDWTFLGFSGLTALLTAIHFHYSSLYTLLFLGLLGRTLKEKGRLSKWYFAGGILLIITPILVALGITYSRVLEIASVSVFMLGLFVYCGLSFSLQSIFIKLSSTSIFISISLSLLYSFRLVDIPIMVYMHGMINTVLFAGFGLYGYLKLSPKSHFDIKDLPISNISGNRKMGIDFFSRQNFVEKNSVHPRGMVDDMGVFERKDFKASNVHPMIKDFYVNTVDFNMDIFPNWNKFFYPLALIYKKISDKMEQMNFPVNNYETTEVNSEMLKIIDKMDQRDNVRAWIRSDLRSRKAIYVAAYSTNPNSLGERFYNVFFPLPFGGMTSILRINHYRNDGVSLTSVSDKRRNDLNGVYLKLFKKNFRIPINETIDVWYENNVLKAYHISYLLGIPVLELHYVMTPRDTNEKEA